MSHHRATRFTTHICICECVYVCVYMECMAQLFLILSGAPGISYDKGRQRLLAYYKEKGEYNAVSRLLVVDDDDGCGGGGIQLKSMSQRRGEEHR